MTFVSYLWYISEYMKRQWEIFTGRSSARADESDMRVTLGRNTFYLNGKAFEALGSPGAVEMMFEGNERIIGLRPVDPGQRNAFRLRQHGKTGNYKRIPASAFCRHIRLDTRSTVLFDEPEIDNDGRMVLDLNSTISVGKIGK